MQKTCGHSHSRNQLHVNAKFSNQEYKDFDDYGTYSHSDNVSPFDRCEMSQDENLIILFTGQQMYTCTKIL